MKNLLLFILFSPIGFLSAQVTYLESDLNLTKHKENDMKFWDLSVNENFQFSIIDLWLQDKNENKFRFGDMLGAKGGVGIGRYTKLQPEKDGHFNIAVNFALMGGAFVGYKTDVFGLFYKYQREVFASIHLQNPANYAYYSNVNTVSFIYKNRHQGDVCIGTPVPKKLENDDQYKLMRFTYKYYTGDDEGSMKDYMGFAVELVDKNNAKAFNTYSFLGGFTF
ncbi:MAG: hypothetical protein CVU05_10740 [Bacteroidetes bacterium HGW-Bacteroidetes-21]|jgi:hypothetical protein|nr:MAG: hypothetical protein CVU05_10740 [Bacteroidetes bacterium HGW-Bacteroidetes-21]